MNEEKPKENGDDKSGHQKEEKLHRDYKDYKSNPYLKKKLEEKRRRSSKKGFKNIAMLSSMGMGLVLNIVFGFLIGNFLDKHFGTFPNWTGTFVVIGVVAGFYNMYYILKKYGDFKF